MTYINLYWKDDCSGKTGGFWRKSSSLYNQAVKVICQDSNGRDADVGTYYPNCKASEKASNRKDLLKIVQTV